MKRFKCVMMMLMVIICLVGCGKYETAMSINPDGTGSIAILYAIDPDKMQEMGMDPETYSMDSIVDELRDRGYTVENYNKDGCEGYVVSASNVDINQAFNNMCVENSGIELVGFSKGNFQLTSSGNNYSIDWYIYNSDSSDKIDAMRQSIEAAGGTARITLYLPSPATDHDANYESDDGCILQWNLLDLGSDQALHAKFTADGSGAAAPSGGQTQPGGFDPGPGQTSPSGGDGNGAMTINLGFIVTILGALAVLGTGLYLYFTYRKKEKLQELYEDYNGGVVNPININSMARMNMAGMAQNNMNNMSNMGNGGNMSGPSPMGMNSGMNSGMNGMPGMGNTAGMGNNPGMQVGQWRPQQSTDMNQMGTMNQSQQTGAGWTPQGSQQMNSMQNQPVQQETVTNAQTIQTPAGQSSPSSIPDWGMNN